MFRVPLRLHARHYATIASWVVKNRETLNINQGVADISQMPGVFTDDLTEWLSDREHKVWWYDGSEAAWILLEFAEPNDRLMYKLTWGGR